MNGLKKQRVYYANSRGCVPTYGFNCWGATAFVVGIRGRLKWIQCGEMTKLLEEHTIVSAREPEPGDIIAMYNEYCLEHTAVYMGSGKWFHKLGSNISEITSLQGVLDSYVYHRSEFRRLK